MKIQVLENFDIFTSFFSNVYRSKFKMQLLCSEYNKVFADLPNTNFSYEFFK